MVRLKLYFDEDTVHFNGLDSKTVTMKVGICQGMCRYSPTKLTNPGNGYISVLYHRYKIKAAKDRYLYVFKSKIID